MAETDDPVSATCAAAADPAGEAARRARALAVIRTAEALARANGMDVRVFGSLAWGGFHAESDLDLAIVGGSPAEAERLADRIWRLAEGAGFPCDVAPLASLPPSLRRLIEEGSMDGSPSTAIERDLATALEALASARLRLGPPDPDSVRQENADLALAHHIVASLSAVESALERCLRAFDGAVPTGPEFHRALLRRAAVPTPSRPALVTDETLALLDQLRRFRHRLRHVYGGFDRAQAETSQSSCSSCSSCCYVYGGFDRAQAETSIAAAVEGVPAAVAEIRAALAGLASPAGE